MDLLITALTAAQALECRLQTIDAITARTPYSSGISTAIAIVIDNVIARDCDRGVRIVMDGNIQADGIVRNVRITNMRVTNPIYEGFSIRNTGALTGVFDIYLVNCFVDSVSSYSLSTFTYPFRIRG
jgi:hypothetical protein